MAADRPTVPDRDIGDFRLNGVLLLQSPFADRVEDLRRGVETNFAAPNWRERIR